MSNRESTRNVSSFTYNPRALFIAFPSVRIGNFFVRLDEFEMRADIGLLHVDVRYFFVAMRVFHSGD